MIFEKENINTFTESSEFLITLFSGFAQAESESLSKNVIWGKQKSAESGKVTFQYKKLLGTERIRMVGRRLCPRRLRRYGRSTGAAWRVPAWETSRKNWRPMVYIEQNHEGIIPKAVFLRVKEEMAQGYGGSGGDMLTLRQRLDVLTAEQAVLLDKILTDMDNSELNDQPRH